MKSQTEADESTELECVDNREFECPNGHGLLRVKSETELCCLECDYERAVLSESSNDEPTEIVDRVDGATVEREAIQGTFEYIVTLEESDLDEIPDTMDSRDLAENIAQSRFTKEIDPTFSVTGSDIRAYELRDHRQMTDADYEFEVTVKFSQND